MDILLKLFWMTVSAAIGSVVFAAVAFLLVALFHRYSKIVFTRVSHDGSRLEWVYKGEVIKSQVIARAAPGARAGDGKIMDVRDYDG